MKIYDMARKFSFWDLFCSTLIHSMPKVSIRLTIFISKNQLNGILKVPRFTISKILLWQLNTNMIRPFFKSFKVCHCLTKTRVSWRCCGIVPQSCLVCSKKIFYSTIILIVRLMRRCPFINNTVYFLRILLCVFPIYEILFRDIVMCWFAFA